MADTVEFGDARLSARWWSKATVDPDRGCWLWHGTKHSSGYGIVTWPRKKTMRLHRLSHEVFIGPIPDGLVVHHWCETNNCFNPAHLEAVTRAENTLASGTRNTHCKRGHPMAGDNLYVAPDGERGCRTCMRLLGRRAKARKEVGVSADHGVVIVDDRLPARFWKKVEIADDGCWTWTGALNASGYGSFGWECAVQLAHRVAYRTLVGDFEPVLTVDHLCGQRACVNPAHLEPVDAATNIRRADRSHLLKTHCPKGHPYSGDNLYVSPRGAKTCRTCHKADHERRDAEMRADPERLAAFREHDAAKGRRKRAELRKKADEDPALAAELRAKNTAQARIYRARLREQRPEKYKEIRERENELRRARLQGRR